MSESGYGDACVQIYNNQAWAKCDCGLTNCLFIGNESVPNANVSASMTGGLSVYDSKRNATVDVYRCTFAYNLSCTTAGSAGLTVADGNVRVRNSIFFGNRNRPGDYKGCDLKLASSTATADIDYTLFGALGVSNVCNSAGEAFTLGNHVYAGDPKFATSFADFESLIVKTNVAASGTVNVWAYRPEPAYWSQVVDLDAHVDADDSPAIDMGDDGPYENEPMPNGGVVNLGAYGNTSEAHVTVVTQPEIVDGKLKVTFPYESSQPHVAFALTGEKTYRATAVLAWTTNGTNWVTYETLYGLGNDTVYDRDWLVAFAQGSTLTVRVTVTAPGAEIRSASDTKSIDYPSPPSYGKGGGPTVCHVRAGATGDGSGSDWFNARTAFPKSNNDILSSQTEVWVADDLPVGTTFGEVTVTGPRTFRGGFSGCECTPTERVTGRVTTVDGNGLSDNGISLSPSTALAFERFHFTRFKKRGAYVNAGSNAKIAFADCRFTANGLGWDSNAQDGGRAVRASSGRANWGNDIAFDRCYFGGNATTNGAHSGKGAVWTSGWGHADFRDCTFETNGVAWWQPLKGGVVTRAGGGTAACITEGCASFARCVFRTNRNGCMSESPSSYGDACVQVVNTQTWSPFACGFTNCLFIGNETVPGGDVTSWNSGALSLYDTTEGGPFDIQSCTFAYNVSCTKSASAGLSVNTGAVRVRNCIFYGNRLRSDAYPGCDLRLSGTGATADVDYTLFTGTGTVHVCDASGNALALGPHVRAADPKFVSALAEADALRAVTNVGTSVVAYLPTPVAHVRRLALNAHLRGRAGYVDETTGRHQSTPHGNSSAIDAGDPLADYAQEPTLFNIGTGGGRLNLGAYGNTPWATLTPFPGSVLRVR